MKIFVAERRNDQIFCALCEVVVTQLSHVCTNRAGIDKSRYNLIKSESAQLLSLDISAEANEDVRRRLSANVTISSVRVKTICRS